MEIVKRNPFDIEEIAISSLTSSVYRLGIFCDKLADENKNNCQEYEKEINRLKIENEIMSAEKIYHADMRMVLEDVVSMLMNGIHDKKDGELLLKEAEELKKGLSKNAMSEYKNRLDEIGVPANE